MKAVLALMLVIALIIGVVFLITTNTQKTPYPSQGVVCTPESRDPGACITLYDPVCGWFDSERIQCITYPCASTYSNGCEACQNPDVSHYTPGECPTP